MSRRKKLKTPQSQPPLPKPPPQPTKVDGLRELYGRARELVQFKQFDEAQRLYDVLRPSVTEPHLKALLLNDVAVLQAVRGNLDDAVQTFTEAVAADPSYQSARENLALL